MNYCFLSSDMTVVHMFLLSVFRCGIDNKNIEPFQLLFVAGLFYMFMAIITVFYLKKIAPKTIVCKNFDRFAMHTKINN